MHASHPDIYKDDNHKPEIAIALSDDFTACFGFLTPEKLRINLGENRVLAEVFEYKEEGSTLVNEEFLKGCVHKMFFEIDKNQDHLQDIISKLLADIETVEESKRS